MGNVGKHRFVTTKKVDVIWCHNQISNKLLLRTFTGNRMRKTEVIMDNPVSLGLSIYDVSKIEMNENWYDYAKPNNRDSVKLCQLHS